MQLNLSVNPKPNKASLDDQQLKVLVIPVPPSEKRGRKLGGHVLCGLETRRGDGGGRSDLQLGEFYVCT